MSTDLTVVIPSFNEGLNVQALLARLDKSLTGIRTEVLYVDDSTDDTPEVIARYALHHASLAVRCLHRDEPAGGLAGAVVAGLAAARSPVVVVMDGDLQHPPETVAELYRKAVLTTADIVVASRYVEGGDSGGLSNKFRQVVSTWSGRIAKAMFPRRLATCSDPMSGFFAVRRDSLRLDSVAQCGYKVLLALLLHRGRLEVAEVPFVFAERHAGESKASLKEGLRYLRLLVLLRSGPGALFALVGASGVLPNLAMVALLTALGLHYVLAAALAVQVAIVWNFVGAELIIFRDRRVGKLWHRAVRYHILSNTDLLRLPFVALLVGEFGVSVLLATALTLVGAVALRYSLAARLVYGVAPADSTPVQTVLTEEVAA